MPAKRGAGVGKREDDKDEGAAGKAGETAHEPNSPPAETPNGTPLRALEGSPSAPGAKRKVPLRACSFKCMCF